MQQHADDVVALLEAQGVSEPVVYIGLSMGGYVGFALWRRHPERVRAFVLADTRAAPDSPNGVVEPCDPTDDQLTPPADSHAIAEAVPAAQLVTIDQAGHMSNLENPEAFNAALLSFIARVT